MATMLRWGQAMARWKLKERWELVQRTVKLEEAE